MGLGRVSVHLIDAPTVYSRASLLTSVNDRLVL